jgi:hypothetical protein
MRNTENLNYYYSPSSESGDLEMDTFSFIFDFDD